MKAKALELRDSATFIPVLAVDLNADEFPAEEGDMSRAHQRYLLRRCGYPCDYRSNVLLTRLSGEGQATNDPYAWGDRTFHVAHLYILENWAKLQDGDVVDVEFILQETKQPVPSERLNPVNFDQE